MRRGLSWALGPVQSLSPSPVEEGWENGGPPLGGECVLSLGAGTCL